MNLIMNDSRSMNLEELKAFVRSSASLEFKGQSREQSYAWIEERLRHYRYLHQDRSHKGVIRQYLQKMTGYSRAQLARLIAQYRGSGQVRVRAYRRHRFPRKFTREDQLLLAEVDEAHERLSGPATVAILRREHEVFGRKQFQRLSTISAAHLYRLRHQAFYRCTTLAKTRPKVAPYGQRRRPDPQGQPGYLRVDTVHQGDHQGQKGVYHLNTVDEVTQWEVIGCCCGISERYLVPVLQDLLAQYPFVVRGFHSDNGGEFINRVVTQLLNKLLIQFTKSRPRRTNDQGLVECKNGAIIRKQMGYTHIPQTQADPIQRFYRHTLNVYLNFHRPCGFATEKTDQRGKLRKCYDTYLTPFEKFVSLPHPQRFLKPGLTLAQLEQLANAHSDTEFAALLQQRKSQLFRSFPSLR
jgi:hypothetical protein